MAVNRLLVLPIGLLFAACATTPPAATTAVPTTAVASPTATASPSASASAATSAATTTPAVTPTPDVGASLLLRGDGLATFEFGAKQAPVAELLSDQLGAPDETSQGILCELNDASPWAETVVYGGLWVQYSAEDKHKSSPRYLTAWGFSLAEEFPPLQLEDDVPLDLGFAALKAKYPKGKLEDLGFGDGTKMFTLPNQLRFIGAKKPVTVQAGQLAVCE